VVGATGCGACSATRSPSYLGRTRTVPAYVPGSTCEAASERTQQQAGAVTIDPMTETSAASSYRSAPVMSDPPGHGSTRATGPTRRPGTARRLSPALRKGLLTAHIVTAVSWIGVDIVLLVLALTALTSTDPRTVAASYVAIGAFTIVLLVPAGVLTLATGLLLGAGTRWGIVRYWWLTVKLVITVVLTTLVILLLRPRVAEVASRAEQAGAAGLSRDQLGNLPVDLVFPPSVSIVALLVATALAVYKPWGKTPFARRRATSGR